MRPLIATIVTILTLVGAACGDSGGDEAAKTPAEQTPPGETGSGSTEIVIKDFAFAPARLEAKAGTPVEVRNEDDAAHTVTASDKSFDTGTLDGGGSKTITPSKAGTYSYVCSIHQYMKGELVVR